MSQGNRCESEHLGFLGEAELPRSSGGRSIPCYLTHTTEETHQIINSGLDRSPLYTGKIVGIGPRYCPSVETKIVRFPDKINHQLQTWNDQT